MSRKTRAAEDMSMSFLDVICCGFGAVILLLIMTKTGTPKMLEQSTQHLKGVVVAREDAIYDIRGKSTTLARELSEKQHELDAELDELAKLEKQVSTVLGKYEATKGISVDAVIQESKLASAKQSLTAEMEELLGTGFRRTDPTVGGIPVDSEYIIFVIDTSGSMVNYGWHTAIQKLNETLQIYPIVKGIQVMNCEGTYMFPGYAGHWIPDSPARRKAIMERMPSWTPFCSSSPTNGIESAVRNFYDPDKRVSIYYFGDDYSGTSLEEVIKTVDRLNASDKSGERRMRIHAVGFPTLFLAGSSPPPSMYRFAALMRELCYRNNGTFVALPETH
jgi:hypothetical protein